MENELFMSMLPTWHSLDILPPELNTSSSSSGGQSPADCFFSPYRDKLNDNPFKFESVSALSSLSSSPVSPPTPVHPATHDSSVIRELIGKLENSPKWGNFNSALNSGTANFSANPRFSGFGSRSFNGRTSRFGLNHCEFPNTMPELTAIGKRVSRVLSSPSLKEPEAQLGDLVNKNFQKEDRAELSHCHEDSSISNPDKVPAGEVGVNLRKRKSAHRGKVAEAENDSNPKRAKQSEGNGNENGVMKTEEEIKGGGCNGTDAAVEEKETNNDSKPTEPPKDYIHVRARRGQATDSHSLAERVRREKISERMKLLQDLVPGCNKVTGKALMLDEIINYVQSLQRQVEFLSMKLSSVNSSVNNMDFNVEAPMMKDVLFQSENTVPPAHPILPLDSSASAFYGQKNPAVNSSNGTIPHCPVDPHQFPPLALDGLNQHVLPYENFCGDDLHSIVQMGFGQSAAFNLQSFHGRNDSSCMKIEL